MFAALVSFGINVIGVVVIVAWGGDFDFFFFHELAQILRLATLCAVAIVGAVVGLRGGSSRSKNDPNDVLYDTALNNCRTGKRG